MVSLCQFTLPADTGRYYINTYFSLDNAMLNLNSCAIAEVPCQGPESHWWEEKRNTSFSCHPNQGYDSDKDSNSHKPAVAEMEILRVVFGVCVDHLQDTLETWWCVGQGKACRTLTTCRYSHCLWKKTITVCHPSLLDHLLELDPTATHKHTVSSHSDCREACRMHWKPGRQGEDIRCVCSRWKVS